MMHLPLEANIKQLNHKGVIIIKHKTPLGKNLRNSKNKQDVITLATVVSYLLFCIIILFYFQERGSVCVCLICIR